MRILAVQVREHGPADLPGNPLYYLVHVAQVALPLYPQFGTEPNGYYIPPRWVPTKYLEQMFGPDQLASVKAPAAATMKQLVRNSRQPWRGPLQADKPTELKAMVEHFN